MRLLGPRRSIGAAKTMVPASRSRSAVSNHLDEVLQRAWDRLRAVHGLTHQIDVSVRMDDGGTRPNAARSGRPATTGSRSASARLLLRLTGYESDGRAVTGIAVTFRLAGVAASRQQEVLPPD